MSVVGDCVGGMVTVVVCSGLVFRSRVVHTFWLGHRHDWGWGCLGGFLQVGWLAAPLFHVLW